MMARLLSVLHARNLEFLRDRSTLLFTLLLPILLVIGMGFVFGGPERPLFKVGVLAPRIDRAAHPFLTERYVEFVPLPQQQQAVQKVRHQQIDLLVDLHAPPRYWVNTDSPSNAAGLADRRADRSAGGVPSAAPAAAAAAVRIRRSAR